MIKKRSMVVLLVGLFLILACTFAVAAEKFAIGITQIVEHPALDAARDGFIQALVDEGFIPGEDLDIEISSAQGDISLAGMIAEEFVREKKDLILAIATPSAQAALNVTDEIPILITAVTDPVASGLAESLASSGNNLTGTTDMTPIDEQFTLIAELFPDTTKIGIIYNAAEINSEIQVEIARQSCQKRGWTLIESTVTNLSEVQIAIEQLAKKVDIIYTPTDNLIASAMPIVAFTAAEFGIPVIGSEAGQVKAGALATLGIDYERLGYQTGLMAVKVLKGTKPQDLPIESLKDLTLVINLETVEQLKLTIPDRFLKEAELIEKSER